MITKILVSLDIIDNGYLDPKRVPSTCAVAQAFGKPLFALHFPSAEVFNNYVLLRRQNDNRDTVFTVSLAFREVRRLFKSLLRATTIFDTMMAPPIATQGRVMVLWHRKSLYANLHVYTILSYRL